MVLRFNVFLLDRFWLKKYGRRVLQFEFYGGPTYLMLYIGVFQMGTYLPIQMSLFEKNYTRVVGQAQQQSNRLIISTY